MMYPFSARRDVHRLGAVGGDSVLLPRIHDRFPDVAPKVGVDVDLVGQLPREADSEDPCRYAGDRALPEGHEGEEFPAEIHVGTELAEDAAAVGSTDRNGRPMVGHGRHVDLQLGPLGLEPELQPGHDVGRTAGGGVHQVVVLAEPGRHPVVHEHAVFIQHETVPAASHGDFQEGVGVDPIQKDVGIGPLDVDLPQRRGVQHTDAAAHRQTLPVDGLVQRLARSREVPRPLPLAHGLEESPLLDVPLVDGRLADGIEQVPLLPSREGGEGDGSVHGPKRGGADGAGVGLVMAGQDGDAVDVPQPALVGTHAQVGVPLDVLDGIVTLPCRGQNVGGGDVHEGVDELLGARETDFTAGTIQSGRIESPSLASTRGIGRESTPSPWPAA